MFWGLTIKLIYNTANLVTIKDYSDDYMYLVNKMSRVMRKPDLCIYAKRKPQIRAAWFLPAVDQRLCFLYIDNAVPLLPKSSFKPLAILCGCTVRFVSDLDGNLEDWLSRDVAQNSPIRGGLLFEPRRDKTGFCICENKDADQLRGNREADQRLCFRYTDSIIPLLSKSEISSF